MFIEPLENVGYFKDDLIIAFNSRAVSKNKKVLTSDKCRVFIKEPEGYRQIGFIQDLHISVDVKNIIADVSISFPKSTTKLKSIQLNSGKLISTNSIIAKNKKDLTALGVTVK